ncbi:hypothetical protein [Shimia thalassica]|uniref:hypothetical protein n=1 Tax=Shimia thalassica TaxID=1715693 RepID=UPI0026E44363|nr:hypothetical protein [Shimia thalassica]MDO6482736.1 hypothetical protein [Shimia thalassica]MDO6800694.1 hypothetical protein [Shimia thalassica]
MIDVQLGDIVTIADGKDWPEHLFRVDWIFDDCVGGYSLTGPLEGEYGEPDFDLILKLHSREGVDQ